MSKVKIQGNASGTGVFTIEAPGTNDPRTLTLPDSTGTLLDENSSLPSANLTGTVATARLGSGTASSSTVLYGDQTYKAAPTTDLTAPGAIGGTTPAAGTFTDLACTGDFILNSDYRFNCFKMGLHNDSGTLKHRPVHNGSASYTGTPLAVFVPDFSGVTWQDGLVTSPLVNSTTDFANGLGLRAANSADVIFDYTSTLGGSGHAPIMLAWIIYQSTSWDDVSPYIGYGVENVNGVSKKRPHILHRSNTGASFYMNTSNIASGKYIVWQILFWGDNA